MIAHTSPEYTTELVTRRQRRRRTLERITGDKYMRKVRLSIFRWSSMKSPLRTNETGHWSEVRCVLLKQSWWGCRFRTGACNQNSGEGVHCDWVVSKPGRSVTVLPPPRPAPEGRGPRRRGGLPLPRGTGRSGYVEWKASSRLGSRMSSLGTQDRSSVP